MIHTDNQPGAHGGFMTEETPTSVGNRAYVLPNFVKTWINYPCIIFIIVG